MIQMFFFLYDLSLILISRDHHLSLHLVITPVPVGSLSLYVCHGPFAVLLVIEPESFVSFSCGVSINAMSGSYEIIESALVGVPVRVQHQTNAVNLVLEP